MLAAAASLLVAAAAPAWAQPPPNNDINNATVITSLPFHDIVDLSQATFNPPDTSSCGGATHAVWYQFTPATSENVAFDLSASSDLRVVDVFTGSPAALSSVGCAQGGDSFPNGFVLNATGGTTYWIMASAVSFAPETITPLVLWVYLALPPQATLSVTGGTVDQAGNTTITGTLDCTGTVLNSVTISGSVTQPVGRLRSVSGSFTTSTRCASAQPWSALAQPNTGRFAGGPATVNLPSPSVCNLAGCATVPSTTAVIKLHG
jgi:hypothetical protein